VADLSPGLSGWVAQLVGHGRGRLGLPRLRMGRRFGLGEPEAASARGEPPSQQADGVEAMTRRSGEITRPTFGESGRIRWRSRLSVDRALIDHPVAVAM
jgi:hypothetical protein